MIKALAIGVLRRLPIVGPYGDFATHHYGRHNQRRLEHLATLGLPIAGKTVLEVGAGIGDHTSFFLDRGCRMITTDGRPRNLAALRRRYPRLDARLLNLDAMDPNFAASVDIVYCYGTLYHLSQPAQALARMSQWCTDLMLLETHVSCGNQLALNPVVERAYMPSQSVTGVGCRPTRAWVYAELKKHFPYVYLPISQPWHEEFPVDWSVVPNNGLPTRAVFIASRGPLDNPQLSEEIRVRQTRG